VIQGLVSASSSQHEFAELEAAAAEHKPRLQAQDKDSSASTPVISSRLPLNTVKIYAQVVPELASLLDHMERKSPILVISTTDGSMDSVLPFQLPPEYGCVVLGFFDVESVEVGSALPSTPQAILRLQTLVWTSVRAKTTLLPRLSNLGNFHGRYDCVIHLQQVRQTRMGI
jgi:hypothetical protein